MRESAHVEVHVHPGKGGAQVAEAASGAGQIHYDDGQLVVIASAPPGVTAVHRARPGRRVRSDGCGAGRVGGSGRGGHRHLLGWTFVPPSGGNLDVRVVEVVSHLGPGPDGPHPGGHLIPFAWRHG